MTEPPFGTLGPEPFILQGTDEWFDEKKGKWLQIDFEHIGKWSDDSYPSHVTLRGYLWRLSDAVHADRFLARYGRPKPPRMYDASER